MIPTKMAMIQKAALLGCQQTTTSCFLQCFSCKKNRLLVFTCTNICAAQLNKRQTIILTVCLLSVCLSVSLSVCLRTRVRTGTRTRASKKTKASTKTSTSTTLVPRPNSVPWPFQFSYCSVHLQILLPLTLSVSLKKTQCFIPSVMCAYGCMINCINFCKLIKECRLLCNPRARSMGSFAICLNCHLPYLHKTHLPEVNLQTLCKKCVLIFILHKHE